MRTALVALSLFVTAQELFGIAIALVSWANPACSTPDGYINVLVSGGIPPYSYSWNNGSTAQNLVGLGPGYYELTVTDAVSAQATQGWNLNATPLTSPPSAQDGHSSCIGSMNGRVQVIEFGINGTPPYSYSPLPSGFDPQGDPYFEVSGVSPGDPVQIQVTDAFGCTGILTQYLMAPQILGGPNMTVSNIQGSCSTGAGGTAVIGNVYDGGYFGGPDYALLDASENYVSGGFNVANTINFNGLPPGDYHMVRDWDPSGVYMAYDCAGNPFDRIDFTIPDLGPDCGRVSGAAFIDHDGDCAQDADDLPIPYQVLDISPGPVYTITNINGDFSIDLPDGGYTLTQTDPTLVQICPAATPVPFTIASNQVSLALADSSTQPLDVSMQLESGPMRPGFYSSYWGEARNLSPQLTGTVTVTVELDPVLDHVSAAPVPSSVTGGTLTWDLPALAPLGSFMFSVNVLVPAATAIGTPLATTASIACAFAENGLLNNNAVVQQLVTGSYDPNDKTARTSSGWSDALYYLDQDEWIDYTIRFQNTGTDTAFTVVITDTLDNSLDMASFQQGVASHAFSVAFKPGRVVEWTFADILLPDSNANEAASHGLIRFRIRPRVPLLPGSVIENIANIYFDFNPPVITEPSVLIAEFSTGQAEGYGEVGEHLVLFPNPGQDRVRLLIPGASSGPFPVEVLTLDGRIARIAQADRQGGFSVAGLAQGTYLVRVRTGAHMFMERFLKL